MRPLENDPVFKLLDCWDDLDASIDRVVTALPAQMSDASKRLEAQRLVFRDMVQKFAFSRSALTEQKP